MRRAAGGRDTTASLPAPGDRPAAITPIQAADGYQDHQGHRHQAQYQQQITHGLPFRDSVLCRAHPNIYAASAAGWPIYTGYIRDAYARARDLYAILPGSRVEQGTSAPVCPLAPRIGLGWNVRRGSTHFAAAAVCAFVGADVKPLITGLTLWRRDDLRTNLWLVPTLEVLAVTALFVAAGIVDRAAYRGSIHLPTWVISGSADAARLILTTIAGAVITVVGIVFSITIVTLTLASTQFGPRMLRNFIRDRGTQLTLGTFVASFVYCILVLVSIGPGDHGDYVPHLSITLTFQLVLIDSAVLIYFIHHIAIQIQLPQVIASIAKDLAQAVELQSADSGDTTAVHPPDAQSLEELITTIENSGAVIRTPKSGYLQFIRHSRLVRIAADVDAVVRLPYRPGHFLVEGREVASVWPPEAADHVARYLEHAQVTGPHRTLTQDVAFGVDQLVEIAVRALSPAVNDPFTAMTCVDWLGDSLCKIARVWAPIHVHRDRSGAIRLISDQVSFERLVQRAFEKIRQASLGMPALMIRQLEALITIMEQTTDTAQARVLMDQAAMILRACNDSVPEESDRADVQRRYDILDGVYQYLGQ
ncbi:MAG TPA: DUF2254 domain-containing protein [Mycobacterium sp.]|nr:DUF2254 domain-containing protein [Mycobacterium sp.]